MSNTADQLIREAREARREGRLADAHRDFAAAVAHSRQSGEQRLLVQALKGLGQIERDLGHGDAALSHYEEAVGLCRQQYDPLLLAHMVRHVSDLHRDAGRFELAEPCYHEALAIYRSNPQTPPLDLANAVRPLAILKGTTGEVKKAKRLWKEARDLYAAVGVPEGVAECSAQLARLSLQDP